MIRLDDNADTLPAGLAGTPFETVYKALRKVAASVWDVNPEVYRAGMAWGWYALHKPGTLAAFRDVVTAALVSAFAPLVKDTQTDAELAEYLNRWRNYISTASNLAGLFECFGVNIEVLPITDAESQSVVPVDDTRLAFYLRITGIDFSRPLSLSEAVEIARRATPLGSRPFAYYAIPSRVSVPCGPAPEPAFVFVENSTVAELPAMGYIVLNSETGAILGAAKGHELETVPIPACTIASPDMVSVPIPARVLESPEMVVYVPEPEPEPDYLEVFFYLNNAEDAKTFGANDYWGSAIIDTNDKSLLENFGVNVSIYGASANAHYCVSRDANSNFSFQPIGLYSGIRTGDLQADMSNFYCAVGPNNTDSLYYGLCIWSIAAYNTNTLTWKCRITRINGGN